MFVYFVYVKNEGNEWIIIVIIIDEIFDLILYFVKSKGM